MLQFVAVVEDPNEETHRMQESLCLYRQFYDLPVSLPSQLASEPSGGGAASDPSMQQVPLDLLT